MGLGLFQRRKKLEEVSHRLHMHLGDLKGYCLLQDGNMEGTVRMHDVVYKFGAFVAFRDHHMFTVADGQLEEWPPKDELEQFSAITLPYCHLPNHQFPKAFDSSKLESFILLKSKDDASLNVPDKFFIGMKALKLVDLTSVSLSPVLPSSLNNLVKLRTLCLDYCELDDIAIIGELPMLQVLSLIGSTVSHVPKEIGSLGSSLKLLDLRRCDHLKVIAPGVFSNLTLLEDLRIGKNFNNWEQLQGCSSSTDHEPTSTTTKKLASLREFKNLRNLINLEIHITDPKMTFPKDLVFEKLERFTIIFGQEISWFSKVSRLGTLRVNHVEDIQLYEGIKTLMGKANSLHLEAVKGVTSVCELDPKGFPELKFLTIEDVVEIQFIVKRGYSNCAVFPKLEYLKFLGMRKLERIIRDDDHHLLLVGSFQNLTTINVESCNVLKYLFLSRYWASHLLCLKEIRLVDCESMNAIIVDDDRYQLDEEGEIEFTQLRTLELYDLPRLISFYSNTPNPIISSSQERQEKDPMLSSSDEIIEDNQRLLTSLFNKKVVLPKLKELELRWIEVDQIWDNQLAIEAERTNCWFQNLTILKVIGCSNLSYLFTFSMVKSLAQLKTLDVIYCDSIEKIVATKGEMTENDMMLSFPALDRLVLESLPKFKRFCHANLLECQSLQELWVKECGALNALITNNGSSPAGLDANSSSTFFHKNVAFPNLQALRIEKCGALNAFITNNDGSSPAGLDANSSSTFFHKNDAFPNLEKLVIGGLHQVKMIWGPEKIVKTQLHLNLRSVIVVNCLALTSIFPASIASLAFKQLEDLSIENCPNLKEIVSKEEKNEDDEEEDGAPTFVFSNLTSLSLSDLPELERFYPGPHSLDWSNFETLKVHNCDRLIEPRNFNIDPSCAKIIPILKDCHLQTTDISVRYQSLSGYLQVDGRRRSRTFPISLLQIFQKLEKVEVSNFSLEQLFPCEPHDLGDDDIHTQALAKTLARPKHLELRYLPKMKHIWSEHYADDQFDGIPQNLKILKVWDCHRLMSLAPSTSTILFQNLTHLTVWGCGGLKKLVASSSTAKSLVNLTEMRVSGCDSLTEIVAIVDHHDHDGEEANNNSDHDTIVFGKLETLELRYLPSLASFCPTTYCNFQFPSLDRVIVVKCPIMEFFSKGALSTPRLSKVNLDDEDEGRWESDLNYTMRQLYKEMNSTDEHFEVE